MEMTGAEGNPPLKEDEGRFLHAVGANGMKHVLEVRTEMNFYKDKDKQILFAQHPSRVFVF